MIYSMKETCKKAEMTYEALKYYCNQGLVPNVKRDKNNYRIFDDNDLEWLFHLTCLKKCGMSIQNMKTYLALCLQGQASIPERQVILDKQREELITQIDDLKKCVEYIDHKQEFYNGVLDGTIKYYSNLIQSEPTNPSNRTDCSY